MCFTDLNAALRNNENFADGIYKDHCKSQLPLLQIPGIRMITDFPLEYMHLVCLGVVRKVLNLWKSGPSSLGRPNTLGNINVRFSSITVRNVSTNLCEIVKFVPREFSRKPRSLHELPYWKATEFRLFLLYLKPIVLQNVGISLTKDIFLHFTMLHVAMRILASYLYMPSMINYAEDLLKLYVEQFSDLYGEEHVPYNVHSLIHLVDDCIKYKCN